MRIPRTLTIVSMTRLIASRSRHTIFASVREIVGYRGWAVCIFLHMCMTLRPGVLQYSIYTIFHLMAFCHRLRLGGDFCQASLQSWSCLSRSKQSAAGAQSKLGHQWNPQTTLKMISLREFRSQEREQQHQQSAVGAQDELPHHWKHGCSCQGSSLKRRGSR